MAERILLVEDSHSLCETIHDFFVGLGYECDAVEDGEAAYKILDDKEYDIILTDVNLPGKDGFAIIEKANLLYPDTSKIIMTAFAGVDDVIHAMKLGAYDFIRKPIPSFEELRIVIERAGGHHRLLRERMKYLQQIEEMNDQLRHFNQTMQQEITNHTRELSEVNRHLQSIDQVKNNLLANISHELRTPLVSVRGYIELFQHGQLGKVTGDFARHLSTCIRNIDRLLSLIDNLIDYADTARGEIDLHISDVDLCASMREAIEPFMPIAKEKGIEVELQFAEPEIMVMADLQRLKQAVSMVIDNAIKFNGNGTKVLVRIDPTASHQIVIVSIEDNGIGILDEHLPHVFDRFYQYVPDGMNNIGGTGMGLAIARDNLRLMGCELRVSSTPGKKTIFHWNMPTRHE